MAAIGVFCGSSRGIADSYLHLAYAVGVELARRGHTLVSGGGCVSMMGAVADGVRSGGARTLGVIPQMLVAREVADTAADELVVTSDMAGRKSIMMEKADAFLTLPGGIGTLDELFEVWTTAALRLHAKPCVLLDHEGFYTPDSWGGFAALRRRGSSAPTCSVCCAPRTLCRPPWMLSRLRWDSGSGSVHGGQARPRRATAGGRSPRIELTMSST